MEAGFLELVGCDKRLTSREGTPFSRMDPWCASGRDAPLSHPTKTETGLRFLAAETVRAIHRPRRIAKQFHFRHQGTSARVRRSPWCQCKRSRHKRQALRSTDLYGHRSPFSRSSDELHRHSACSIAGTRRAVILRVVMSERIGERHASACRYKSDVPEG